MDFVEKSKVMKVLSQAYAGSVVDKRSATAAIMEFEEMLSDLRSGPLKKDLIRMRRDEVDNMREVIKYQEKKMKEITDRINKMSNETEPHYPISTDKFQTELKQRQYLADSFSSLYAIEWKAAFTELSSTLRWTEPECIYSLMRVIRNACDLCIDLAEDQMDKLVVGMEDNIIDPLTRNGGRLKKAFENIRKVYSDGMKIAEKYALKYRTERASTSVPAVIEIFMDIKLRAIIEPSRLGRCFKQYIERCVELVWLMTVLDPPMRLFWQQQNERANPDFFSYNDGKGEFVNQTVWPAVFVHNTGQLIYKGVLLTM